MTLNNRKFKIYLYSYIYFNLYVTILQEFLVLVAGLKGLSDVAETFLIN
jgi:hypothetical protein